MKQEMIVMPYATNMIIPQIVEDKFRKHPNSIIKFPDAFTNGEIGMSSKIIERIYNLYNPESVTIYPHTSQKIYTDIILKTRDTHIVTITGNMETLLTYNLINVNTYQYGWSRWENEDGGNIYLAFYNPTDNPIILPTGIKIGTFNVWTCFPIEADTIGE